MHPLRRRLLSSAPLVLGLAALLGAANARSEAPSAAHPTPLAPDVLIDRYCTDCHNDIDRKAGLSLEDLRADDIAQGRHADIWEKVLRRTALGEMPPRNKPQPDAAARDGFTGWLTAGLDAHAFAHPDPGRATLRRLNRAEYANAVRDLLALDIDAGRDLPPDNSGYGFDNIADVLSVSPTLLDRYVTVAGKVSRLATGQTSPRAFVTSYEVPKDGSILNQGRPAWNERMSDDLPLASRGGGSFAYYARKDASYEIAGILNANTNNETDRLREDRYAIRVPLKAGRHVIGLSFRRTLSPDETVERVTNTTDAVVLPVNPPGMLPLIFSVDGRKVGEVMVPSYRMHPRFAQANWPRDVLQIDVTGPMDPKGAGWTPSRARIFSCQPAPRSDGSACASTIATRLARLAWRRPVSATDIAPLVGVYRGARAGSGGASFEDGVQAMVEAILVSPQFLFVRETDPPLAAPGSIHALTDIDLATRLSLFLWSSIPDERLLDLAEAGSLHDPVVLDGEVTRMLADPRASALTTNFAGQWLYLRNLDQQHPDVDAFPAFDTRLKQAMGRETALFFAHVLKADRPILDFLDADYTFLNQRLADHYGVPGVKGPAMRKVALDRAWHRGGLLGQGSVLMLTSYANHTSVVRRGKWILENLLAAPPPPPPADVPALKERAAGRLLSARQQIEMHRADPACSGCHIKMDPLGFALENYDAVGRFRTADLSGPVDATALMPDGVRFTGADGLRGWLLDNKDQFSDAFARKLLTYALGRGLEAPDMPVVRKIAADARTRDYRMQAYVRAIVTSMPFTHRKVPEIGNGPAMKAAR